MRPDRLACRFDALTPDHACNRTLKTALHVLRPWIGDVALARQWLELNLAFDEVGTLPAGAPPPSVPRERDLRRYAAALTWARWILELLSPSLRAGAEAAPALLFDMNRLFEQAVATHLRRRAQRRGLHLRTQDTGHHLAHSADASARAHFGLRPDLVLANDHAVVCVADTKWCRLDIDAHGRCSPASSHLYQLNAYASVYACGELALIYPYQGSPRSQGGDAYHLPSRGGARPLLQVVCLDVSREGLPWVGDAAPTALAGVLRDGPSTP
jgi:5-methylcytosine-specific restriction enzyme subunit McrC